MSDRATAAKAANRDLRELAPEKREALRRVIIELFSKALFHDVGLREICARAGVTPRTVYKHFGAKDDLLLAAIAPDLESLSHAIEAAVEAEGDFEDKALFALRAYSDFYLGNIPVARIVFLNIPAAYFRVCAEIHAGARAQRDASPVSGRQRGGNCSDRSAG